MRSVFEYGTSPTVSVCIPAYQQPTLVKRAVASVFSQDFNNFEVVVTDDSENSEVFEVLAPWHNDPRLAYHRNSERLGSPANWNASLRLSKSNLIKILHHDDWFSETHSLGRFVRVMNDRPDLQLAFSASRNCDDDGTVVSVHCPSKAEIDRLQTKPLLLNFGNVIGSPSATIFRKPDGFEFDARLCWVVDIDAYLRLIGTSPHIGYVQEPLVCIGTGGSHRVTHIVSQEPAKRVAEHLHLYASHRPTSLYDRLISLRYLMELTSCLSGPQLRALRTARVENIRTVEEEIACLTRALRISVTHAAARLKKIFYIGRSTS